MLPCHDNRSAGSAATLLISVHGTAQHDLSAPVAQSVGEAGAVSAELSPQTHGIDVSVIVPMYNTARYLPACLESLARQTLPAIEFILIDDGSPDDSGRIADDYARRDARFRVIHQPNRGISAARNTGIAHAKGTYLGFIDADDTAAPAMFATLHAAALREDVDLVMCGMDVYPTPLPCGRRLERAQIDAALVTAHATRLLWYNTRNLYRADWVREHGNTFDVTHKIGVDSCFNLRAFLTARAIFAVEDVLYFHRENTDSHTHFTHRPNLVRELALQYQGKRDICRQFGIEEVCLHDLHLYVLRHTLLLLLRNVKNSGRPGKLAAVREILNEEMVRDACAALTLDDLRDLRKREIALILAVKYHLPALAYLIGKDMHRR